MYPSGILSSVLPSFFFTDLVGSLNSWALFLFTCFSKTGVFSDYSFSCEPVDVSTVSCIQTGGCMHAEILIFYSKN